MVADAALALDQIRNTRRGPQAGFVPQHFWATLEFLRDAPQLGGAQPRLASGASGFLQSGTTFPLHAFRPAMNRLPVHAQRPRHFRLTVSPLE
jgi:hypothetical protein